jgi:SulP family sulfate permease
MVVGVRMIDTQTFHLLKQKATLFDFIVILAVVITAVGLDLMSAAGVGVGFAILFFLRDQISASVVRRSLFGNTTFSKKRRHPDEMAILETKGGQTAILQLDGDLFFGTTDQPLSEIQNFLPGCRYLILNMKRVRSLDFTAAHRLEQIATQLSKKNGRLILTDVPRAMSTGQDFEEYLRYVGLMEGASRVLIFEEQDDGLE